VTNTTYLVVGRQPWNHRVFDEVIGKYPGQWHFIEAPKQLTLDAVGALDPRYIFFLHWSWKVPEEIVDAYECVVFHMTDVPYGRGGSPLQNLVVRGHRHTKLTALRMTHEFDAGPVYLKEDLCLEGSAEEIYIRATHLSAQMISHIIREEPKPVPQTGEEVLFERRKPDESEIPERSSLRELHDFIRMLDAEGYPRAFIIHQGFRYEFSRAALRDGRIMADVTITQLEDGKP
jgi:methionyl-tRNA formyltransferase